MVYLSIGPEPVQSLLSLLHPQGYLNNYDLSDAKFFRLFLDDQGGSTVRIIEMADCPYGTFTWVADVTDTYAGQPVRKPDGSIAMSGRVYNGFNLQHARDFFMLDCTLPAYERLAEGIVVFEDRPGLKVWFKAREESGCEGRVILAGGRLYSAIFVYG
ncbi:hypothetical protein M419DRAFT_33361 [Trichoderma reesei RUT C-30]|uniref:Uncharacterized protein n=1 Tax=Hypocrea jecorina (strain ATCC 56765 / BCRC 32924 / NRRL 11460 / Rut C-30) TaxID=1344414 RepID=A0A024SIK9_HYPJR|nr:hypothetical protein M419DRAFT_33361 [Trichoderma reesei RUT C-30]